MYENLNKDYNLINREIQDWNNRLVVIAERNQFLNLEDYLTTKNYRESWGKEIAIYVFREAIKKRLSTALIVSFP